ncbi:MAG: MarR family transcriptional regulator [Deltaproteobacteria bacterium]|nr:MarR family transcriptional regulator [Deltaproteobacteria bacterium]
MLNNENLISDIINNVRRLFQIVNEQSKKAEKETGITGPQLWAIKVIGDAISIKISDLAKRMYLHPATVVGILDRLESQRLVLRERSTKDRRVVNVRLTDQGDNLLKNAPEVAQGLLVEGLEAFSAEKLKMIDDGLESLVEILGAQKIPPYLIRSNEININRKRSELDNNVS